MLPCATIFSVAMTRTPVPSWKPVAACVSAPVCPPAWRMFWYNKSSKTARSRLKPVVLTLAKLFEITFMRVCCASKPVFATQSEASMVWSSFVLYLSIDWRCGYDARIIEEPFSSMLFASLITFMAASKLREWSIRRVMTSTALTLEPSTASGITLMG